MLDEYRADAFNLKILDKLDSNGYLRIKATFTKPGVFSYPQKDGTIRRELRHPDEVLNQDSINTLKLVPVFPAWDHVKSALKIQRPNDTKNSSGILGTTGENINIRADNEGLDGSLTLYDKETIVSVVNNPEMEVSASYFVRHLDKTPGVYKGEHYDAKQIGIIYGHVSLVKKGRAGSECQIRADQAEQLNNEERNMIKRKIPAITVGNGQNEFRADALEIEETPWSLQLLERSDKAVEALRFSNVRADKAEGMIVSLKKETEELKKSAEEMITLDQHRADVKDSIELLGMAEELKIRVNDDYTVRSLKKDICLKYNPELDQNRADVDDSFLDGVYSGIKNNWKRNLTDSKTITALLGSDQFKNGGAADEVNSKGYLPPQQP